MVTAVSNVATGVESLAARGAKTILASNVMALGRLPDLCQHVDRTLSAGITALAVAFNEMVAPLLTRFTMVTGSDRLWLDALTLIGQPMDHPSSFAPTHGAISPSTAPLIEGMRGGSSRCCGKGFMPGGMPMLRSPGPM